MNPEESVPASRVPAEVTFGLHHARCEGRFLIVYFDGPLTLSEFLQFRAYSDAVVAAQGGVYVLCHAAQSGGVTAEARRKVVEWATSSNVLGVANIRAGMMVRGLASLLANAIRLVSGRMPPIAFVATEQEARAWAQELERKASAR